MNAIENRLGADPEVFIRDFKFDRMISVHEIGLPGTKLHPYKTNYGACQVDGVAAEFNINPTDNLKTWLKSLDQGVSHIDSFAKRANPDYGVFITPVALFDQEYFDRIPDFNKELGCNPDYDAYKGMPNEAPHTNEPFRTGAGHIHIGWYPQDLYIADVTADIAHFNDCMDLVQDLDASLFVLSHLWDNDVKRRTLYGRRGSFRPKPYGVEYRPLSNAWLRDRILQAFVFNATMHTIELLDNDIRLSRVPSLLGISSKPVITKADAKSAYEELVKKWGYPELPGEYLNG
jgi:hypothetical protein